MWTAHQKGRSNHGQDMTFRCSLLKYSCQSCKSGMWSQLCLIRLGMLLPSLTPQANCCAVSQLKRTSGGWGQTLAADVPQVVVWMTMHLHICMTCIALGSIFWAAWTANVPKYVTQIGIHCISLTYQCNTKQHLKCTQSSRWGWTWGKWWAAHYTSPWPSAHQKWTAPTRPTGMLGSTCNGCNAWSQCSTSALKLSWCCC